ncbi:MAG TPA: cardiolipin synthase ClsB [Castellaniella sp.]|nr:cardiolipin synthase ClsB [Castellaniella sp.]
MSADWYPDNEFELFENGDALFPAMDEAISKAQHQVLAETFILFEDRVGLWIQGALIGAARRGISVDLMVDGYGSDGLSQDFLAAMVEAGVRVHQFDPKPRLLGMRTHMFRRLHRKLLVVDDEIAFIGGINFSEDHLTDFGDQAKQDYAVSVRGPLCSHMGAFMRQALKGPQRREPRNRGTAAPEEDGIGKLLVRDNHRHRDDIERAYRMSLRAANHDVLIANAYFFPGYRLLRDMAKAARRGVRVRLILQGAFDLRVARIAANMLYEYLLDAGVEIYEYCRRPLHAKVACFDDDWAMVGSSNLDPFSLAFNLEANVIVRDHSLNWALRQNLDHLLTDDCSRMPRAEGVKGQLRRMWTGVVVYHILRRFPAWTGSLPAHKPHLEQVVLEPEAQNPEGKQA